MSRLKWVNDESVTTHHVNNIANNRANYQLVISQILQNSAEMTNSVTKDKFRGSTRNSAVRKKLWALLMTDEFNRSISMSHLWFKGAWSLWCCWVYATCWLFFSRYIFLSYNFLSPILLFEPHNIHQGLNIVNQLVRLEMLCITACS